ncbi:MAG: hypothetical protein LQ341_002420 [Variospora aurantia]|nr:MAG: hypothetical protein LQ341_002420 [Variospora aurantia]
MNDHGHVTVDGANRIEVGRRDGDDMIMSDVSKYSVTDSTSSSLLAKSTKGATYLILLQIGSRALTFLVNQILLRFLSPELLGISTQLELYSISVLFFARESLRVALQRQDDDDTAEPARPESTNPSQSRTISKKQHQKTQEVVNLSYIAIGLGLPLALLFAALYIRNADPLVLETPAIKASVNLYIFATVLELLSEPCFAVGQQQLLYGTRALAETLATFTRCVLTCGTAVWASETNTSLGALPFAIGQVGYAVVLNILYLARIGPFGSDAPFSIFIRPIHPTSASLLWDRFPLARLTLAFNIYAQSIFKHILTTGDSLLIAAFASLQSQGAYTLASNYGGLVARMVFQPIEESSRSLFGRLLHQTTPSSISSNTVKVAAKSERLKRMDQAAEYVRTLLRLYSLISIAVVALGPPFSPLLLYFLAGSRWSNSDAPSVLAAYCYYVPLLAVNGILEAFVSAAASPAQLRAQSVWMVAFSATFAATGVLVLKVWDQGARGLVLANAVNMTCRIVWSSLFVSNHLRLQGAALSYWDALPSTGTMICGFGTSCYLKSIEKTFFRSPWHALHGVAAAGGFGLAM